VPFDRFRAGDRKTITGKNRFRKNTGHFLNGIRWRLMSDMFGIRPPLQGWESYRVMVPRALPWADMVRPVGAGESRRKTDRGRSMGNGLGNQKVPFDRFRAGCPKQPAGSRFHLGKAVGPWLALRPFHP
jgi:hypothetical protein